MPISEKSFTEKTLIRFAHLARFPEKRKRKCAVWHEGRLHQATASTHMTRAGRKYNQLIRLFNRLHPYDIDA